MLSLPFSTLKDFALDGQVVMTPLGLMAGTLDSLLIVPAALISDTDAGPWFLPELAVPGIAQLFRAAGEGAMAAVPPDLLAFDFPALAAIEPKGWWIDYARLHPGCRVLHERLHHPSGIRFTRYV